MSVFERLQGGRKAYVSAMYQGVFVCRRGTGSESWGVHFWGVAGCL